MMIHDAAETIETYLPDVQGSDFADEQVHFAACAFMNGLSAYHKQLHSKMVFMMSWKRSALHNAASLAYLVP